MINDQINKLPQPRKIQLESDGAIIKNPDRVALCFNEYFNGITEAMGSVNLLNFDCSNIALNSSSRFFVSNE